MEWPRWGTPTIGAVLHQCKCLVTCTSAASPLCALVWSETWLCHWAVSFLKWICHYKIATVHCNIHDYFMQGPLLLLEATLKVWNLFTLMTWTVLVVRRECGSVLTMGLRDTHVTTCRMLLWCAKVPVTPFPFLGTLFFEIWLGIFDIYTLHATSLVSRLSPLFYFSSGRGETGLACYLYCMNIDLLLVVTSELWWQVQQSWIKKCLKSQWSDLVCECKWKIVQKLKYVRKREEKARLLMSI